MNTEQQWIPLSGPGGRLPTEADYPLVLGRMSEDYGWNQAYADKPGMVMSFWSHWFQQNRVPAPPKPAVKSEVEKDGEEALSLVKKWRSTPETIEALMLNAIRYGRADGRRQLAEEALGLFEPCNIEGAVQSLESIACLRTAKLHELLTTAKEMKP